MHVSLYMYTDKAHLIAHTDDHGYIFIYCNIKRLVFYIFLILVNMGRVGHIYTNFLKWLKVIITTFIFGKYFVTLLGLYVNNLTFRCCDRANHKQEKQ